MLTRKYAQRSALRGLRLPPAAVIHICPPCGPFDRGACCLPFGHHSANPFGHHSANQSGERFRRGPREPQLLRTAVRLLDIVMRIKRRLNPARLCQRIRIPPLSIFGGQPRFVGRQCTAARRLSAINLYASFRSSCVTSTHEGTWTITTSPLYRWGCLTVLRPWTSCKWLCDESFLVECFDSRKALTYGVPRMCPLIGLPWWCR